MKDIFRLQCIPRDQTSPSSQEESFTQTIRTHSLSLTMLFLFFSQSLLFPFFDILKKKSQSLFWSIRLGWASWLHAVWEPSFFIWHLIFSDTILYLTLIIANLVVKKIFCPMIFRENCWGSRLESRKRNFASAYPFLINWCRESVDRSFQLKPLYCNWENGHKFQPTRFWSHSRESSLNIMVEVKINAKVGTLEAILKPNFQTWTKVCCLIWQTSTKEGDKR